MRSFTVSSDGATAAPDKFSQNPLGAYYFRKGNAFPGGWGFSIRPLLDLGLLTQANTNNGVANIPSGGTYRTGPPQLPGTMPVIVELFFHNGQKTEILHVFNDDFYFCDKKFDYANIYFFVDFNTLTNSSTGVNVDVSNPLNLLWDVTVVDSPGEYIEKSSKSYVRTMDLVDLITGGVANLNLGRDTDTPPLYTGLTKLQYFFGWEPTFSGTGNPIKLAAFHILPQFKRWRMTLNTATAQDIKIFSTVRNDGWRISEVIPAANWIAGVAAGFDMVIERESLYAGEDIWIAATTATVARVWTLQVTYEV